MIFIELFCLILQLSKSENHDDSKSNTRMFLHEEHYLKLSKDINKDYYFSENQSIGKVYIDENSLGQSHSISKYLFYKSSINY